MLWSLPEIACAVNERPPIAKKEVVTTTLPAINRLRQSFYSDFNYLEARNNSDWTALFTSAAAIAKHS